MYLQRVWSLMINRLLGLIFIAIYWSIFFLKGTHVPFKKNISRIFLATLKICFKEPFKPRKGYRSQKPIWSWDWLIKVDQFTVFRARLSTVINRRTVWCLCLYIYIWMCETTPNFSCEWFEMSFVKTKLP